MRILGSEGLVSGHISTVVEAAADRVLRVVGKSISRNFFLVKSRSI